MQNPKQWQGTITIKCEAEFVYEIDEDWEATSSYHARQLALNGLNEYLGNVSNRFKKTWTEEETNV